MVPIGHAAASEVALLIFFLIGIVGTWDGLVRRHIRLTLDVIDTDVHIRKVPAILLGALCVFDLLVVVNISVTQLRQIVTSCSSLGCVLHSAVLPALTEWQTVLVALVFLALFVVWVRGALDLHGPYQRVMLAPHVWYAEKELVRLVAQRLHQAHLPNVNEDTVLKMSTALKRRIPRYYAAHPEVVMKHGRVDYTAQATVFLNSSTARKLPLSNQAQMLIAETILEYYLDRHEQAVQVWPWRKKLLGY